MLPLLQLLQEASSLSLVDLKKAMLKDKSVAGVFKKALSVADIDDKDAFLSTIKFYVLNNDKVWDFISSRGGARDLDARALNSYQKMRGSELTQEKLDWLREFIQGIFKEHDLVTRDGASRELKRLLSDWFNGDDGRVNFPPWATQELEALHVRPDVPVVLYRGLFLTKEALRERWERDGTLEVGNGLKFLRSIRGNKWIVDLELDHPSSWTRKREAAERFVRRGSASSRLGTMINWLDNDISNQAIDGVLGFVISVTASPEDALLDTDKFYNNFHLRYGNEGEVILRPGKYTGRILKKFTVKGEVDPTASATPASASLIEVIDKLRELASSFKILDNLAVLVEKDHGFSGVTSLTRDWSSFKKLVLNSTTTQVLHAYDRALASYKDAFKNISEDDLRPDKYVDDDVLQRQVMAAREVYRWFNEPVYHSKFKKSAGAAKPRGPRHDLTAEEYRQAFRDHDLEAIEKPLLVGSRITGRDEGYVVSSIAKALGVNVPPLAELRALSAQKQAKIVDNIISAFFKKLNLTKNDNRMENIRTFIALLKKAHRNQNLIRHLVNLRETLKKV